MTMKPIGPIVVVLAAALALTGCAGIGGPDRSPVVAGPAGSGSPSAASPTATPRPAGGTGSSAQPGGAHTGTGDRPGGGATERPTPSPSTAVPFPAGQPPRPGRQDQYPSSDTVPGLTAAIASTPHPGLQICGDDIGSIVTASGDLRGDGGTQYLVDTTCADATGSSPDEVSLYDVHGGAIARSAVLSEFSANRPKPSAYPYVWQQHTVVLAYDDGTAYRLVQLSPDAVTPGVVQSFR
ncbi:hypothetical protein [Curtobacterium aetherium]|uniref:Uncharacterized protein n=1 Tax=Curtobacterium aetherium TaxID=2841594 RepID=A0ACD1E4K5_9MICO|nr:hypothetical protein [Curtobacterium sp. L6-1]QWS33711.1 hypothetical protein KM842_00335 [Curtobacterium sp. L6-1]